jgi:integrase
LYPAFMLLLLYVLRRGEVLGLRWRDVDEDDGEIRIRQQVQRMRGELQLYSVTTAAGRRDLPLLPVALTVLDLRRHAQAADRAELGRAWQDNRLVFTTKTGRPVEPRNLVRSFHRICAAHSLRDIKVHHLRHTTATLLKNLGVPGPRRSDHPRPLPAGHHLGDLHPRGPPGSPRRTRPDQRSARP